MGKSKLPHANPLDQRDQPLLLPVADSETAAGDLGRLKRQASAAYVPLSVCGEVWDLLTLTLPVFVASIAFVGMKTTDTSLMGHVGSDALDASSYSDLYTQSSGVFITAGSLGVFTGQAYGAKNYKMVGVWLQVAYASIAIIAIPVVALWAVTGPALKAFGVDPKLANMAWYVSVCHGGRRRCCCLLQHCSTVVCVSLGPLLLCRLPVVPPYHLARVTVQPRYPYTTHTTHILHTYDAHTHLPPTPSLSPGTTHGSSSSASPRESLAPSWPSSSRPSAS